MHSALRLPVRTKSHLLKLALTTALLLAFSGITSPQSWAASSTICSSNKGTLLLSTSIRASQLDVVPCIEKQTVGSLVQYRPVVMWRNTGGLAVDFNSIHINVQIMIPGSTKYVASPAAMTQPSVGTVNAANTYTFTSMYTGPWLTGHGYVGVIASTDVDVRDDGAGMMHASATSLLPV